MVGGVRKMLRLAFAQDKFDVWLHALVVAGRGSRDILVLMVVASAAAALSREGGR